MDQILEQPCAIKFCVKLSKNGLEMLRKACDNEGKKKRPTFMWHKRFRKGRVSVSDDGRSGRPSTSQREDLMQEARQVLDKYQ